MFGPGSRSMLGLRPRTLSKNWRPIDLEWYWGLVCNKTLYFWHVSCCVLLFFYITKKWKLLQISWSGCCTGCFKKSFLFDCWGCLQWPGPSYFWCSGFCVVCYLLWLGLRGVLEAWLGLENHAQGYGFYPTRSEPRRPRQASIYEACSVLFFGLRVLGASFGFSWAARRTSEP